MRELYNKYIPDETIFDRIPEDDLPPPNAQQNNNTSSGTEKNAGISGILKRLKLDNLDKGDILLLLILLFLLLEGDNIELVIALGLILLLSLNHRSSDEAPSHPEE